MPIHDWGQVDAGMFHEFHLEWISTIKGILNEQLLPTGYFAMSERCENFERLELEAATRGRKPPKTYPDVLALQLHEPGRESKAPQSLATLEKPRLKPLIFAERDVVAYRQRRRRVVVRETPKDRLVAVIEIVSRGNKSSTEALTAFVKKVHRFLEANVHVLIIDIQNTTNRDPHGLHGVIWDRYFDGGYKRPAKKPFTFASYEASDRIGVYVAHASTGDACPTMPLFLAPQQCVNIPIETTYQAAWNRESWAFRDRVENPA